MKGHFHFAEKKGYAGVGLYSSKRAERRACGFGDAEFDAEGRYVESCASTRRPAQRSQRRQLLLPERLRRASSARQAKFRFLDADGAAPACALESEREFILVRRHQHRPQGDRPQELARQPARTAASCPKSAPG